MCKPSDPRRLHLADQSNASERHLIIMPTFVDVPEIKLIRTDTTLDLSQKAEKVCLIQGGPALINTPHRARVLMRNSKDLQHFSQDPQIGPKSQKKGTF